MNRKLILDRLRGDATESDELPGRAARPAGTYARGNGRLVNGVARVPLGETFQWVTNPDIGLTAHLTPRGAATLLFVESLSTTELVVRGLEESDATFDYVVFGLRIGFEGASVVTDKTIESMIPSMKVERELFEREPELAGTGTIKVLVMPQ